MSCASVADEELDDNDELVLLLSLSNSFSARKACSLRFLLAAGPRDLEGELLDGGNFS